MRKSDNKTVKQLSTKMLPCGRVRTANIITRRGHEIQNEEMAGEMRKDIPFTKWKKKDIKAVFTEDYVRNLLARAQANIAHYPQLPPMSNEPSYV